MVVVNDYADLDYYMVQVNFMHNEDHNIQVIVEVVAMIEIIVHVTEDIKPNFIGDHDFTVLD